MQFYKEEKPMAHDAPIGPDPTKFTFPDHPVFPTKPAVFDDREFLACVDCKYFNHVTNFSPRSCAHPKWKYFNVVQGWRPHKSAKALRLDETKCGRRASGFQPRPPKRHERKLLAAFIVAALVVLILVLGSYHP